MFAKFIEWLFHNEAEADVRKAYEEAAKEVDGE